MTVSRRRAVSVTNEAADTAVGAQSSQRHRRAHDAIDCSRAIFAVSQFCKSTRRRGVLHSSGCSCVRGDISDTTIRIPSSRWMLRGALAPDPTRGMRMPKHLIDVLIGNTVRLLRDDTCQCRSNPEQSLSGCCLQRMARDGRSGIVRHIGRPIPILDTHPMSLPATMHRQCQSGTLGKRGRSSELSCHDATTGTSQVRSRIGRVSHSSPTDSSPLSQCAPY